MLCKPSFPSPNCQALDCTDGINFRCSVGEGIIGGYKINVYDGSDMSEVWTSGYVNSVNEDKKTQLDLNYRCSVAGSWLNVYIFEDEAGVSLDNFNYIGFKFNDINASNFGTIYMDFDGSNIHPRTYQMDSSWALEYYNSYYLIEIKKIKTDISESSKLKSISFKTRPNGYLKPEKIFKEIALLPSGIALNSFPIYSGTDNNISYICNMDSTKITNGKDYIWNISLYEKEDVKSNILINYGNLMGFTASSSSKTATFTLRPDTSLADKFKSDGTPKDGNKVYINIKGYTHELLTYKLVKSSESGVDLYTSATATIDYDEPRGSYFSGDYYSITINNVVSDNYIFYARSNPSLEFKVNGNIIGADTPATITSSEVEMTAVYSQAENVPLNNYMYYIYEVSEFSSKNIYKSKRIYSSNIKFKYSQFMSDKQYKVVIDLTDFYGRVTTFEYQLNPSYVMSPSAYTPIIEFSDKTSSVMIDWSNTRSIVPKINDESGVTELLIENNSFSPVGIDTNRNGVMLSTDTIMTWDTVNDLLPLSIPYGSEYMWEGTIIPLYNGRLLEVEDDEGSVSYIEVHGDKFHIKHFNGMEEIYSMYNEEYYVFDNSEATENTRYTWMDNNEWTEENTFHENSLKSDYWWRVVVKQSSIVVTKISKINKGGE